MKNGYKVEFIIKHCICSNMYQSCVSSNKIMLVRMFYMYSWGLKDGRYICICYPFITKYQ
jgi:hypothetical protein